MMLTSFCKESQVKGEVRGVLDFIEHTYKIFGFIFNMNPSTMSANHHGDLATWEKVETVLKEALIWFGKP